jgi:hypothetical protein
MCFSPACVCCRGGAGPASSIGKPIRKVGIAGHSWYLYEGVVGTWKVYVSLLNLPRSRHPELIRSLLPFSLSSYSYVTAQGDITKFSADLKLFFSPSSLYSISPVLPKLILHLKLSPLPDDLVNNQGVNGNQLLSDVQAGTEPFSGQATLTTSKFNAAIKL